MCNGLCQAGTNPAPQRPRAAKAGDIYESLGSAERWSIDQGGAQVESNERYYRRRAVEERMAARRAMTEAARTWHAKLAEDFAARAAASDMCGIGATSALSV